MKKLLFILILFASCEKEPQPQLSPAPVSPFGTVTFTAKNVVPLISIYNSQITYDPIGTDYNGNVFTKDSIAPGAYRVYLHTSLKGSETIEGVVVTAGQTTVLTSNLY